MTDYRAMFDREYLGSWDLQGNDVDVVIREVKGVEMKFGGGKKEKRPVVFFEGKDRGLVANKTIAKAIAAMYGKDTRKWVGKPVTLYPTTTSFGNETHDCVRVRPQPPRPREQRQQARPEQRRDRHEEAPREPGDEQ